MYGASKRKVTKLRGLNQTKNHSDGSYGSVFDITRYGNNDTTRVQMFCLSLPHYVRTKIDEK